MSDSKMRSSRQCRHHRRRSCRHRRSRSDVKRQKVSHGTQKMNKKTKRGESYRVLVRSTVHRRRRRRVAKLMSM